MEKVRRRLGFKHCFIVDRVGHSGGLAMLWNLDIQLSLLSYSQNHIDMEVEGMVSSNWRFTGYYGHLERHNRKRSWLLLRDLAAKFDLPWLISEDFNDLLHLDEKLGGTSQPKWMLHRFRDVVDACDLAEVQMVGGHFTWRRGGVKEKLDRGLATPGWRTLFPRAKVRLLFHLSFYHFPLWITLEHHYLRQTRRKKSFRFEEMWLRDPGYQEIVQSSWVSFIGMGDWSSLLQKMRLCSAKLQRWNSSHFGRVQKRESNV
ncbi:hypothetical protein SLE2022_249380 [Rubroshorea leprosula]